MAVLAFKVEADLEKVQKLREEIKKLKDEIQTLNGVSDKMRLDQLNKKLGDATKEFNQLTEAAAKNGAQIEKSVFSLTKTLGALGGIAALKGLVSQMISVRGEFQKADTAIQTMLGSKEKADALLSEVRQYAKISPLEFGDITRATQMMLGFNIEAEKVPGFIKAIGDVSMGEGSKFNSLTLAFSQMSAAGKLMGQDLNQMINAGFNPLSVMAEKTGKSIGQLKEEMSKGAITAEMVQQAFIDATSAGGKFYNMSENAAKTIEGQMSMMHDALDAMFNELGTKSEGIIVGSIESITKLIENYEKVGAVLLSLAGTYGAYRTAVALATLAEKEHAITQTITSAKILFTRKAQELLNATMLNNPYVLATVALGGLATALVIASDSMSAAEHAQKNFDDEMEKNNKLVSDAKEEVDKLIAVLRDETATQEERTTAYNTLISLYPSLLAKYNSEKALVADLTGAYQLLNAEIAKKEKLQFQQSYDDAKNRVRDLKRIKELQEQGYTAGNNSELSGLISKNGSYLMKNGKGLFLTSDKAKTSKALEVAENELSLISGEAKDRQIKERSANIKNFTKTQAEAEKKRWSDAINRAKKSGKTRIQDKGTESISIEEAESYVQSLDTHINTERKTMKQWLQAQKEETKNARQNANKTASSDEKLTKEEAEKRMKAANDAVAASEKAEKNFAATKDKSASAAAKAAAKAKRDKEREDEKAQKEEIKQIEAQEKISELKSKQDLERERAAKDLEFSTREATIKAKEESTDKVIEQIDLDYDREMEAIRRGTEDLKQKRIDEAKALWDADPSNKGKNFYASSAFSAANVNTEAELNNQIEQERAATQEWMRRRQEVYQAETDAMNNYLKAYGTYQEQRLAIESEYDQKIADARTEGEKLMLGKQKEAELQGVDERFGLVTQAMADLFADASKKSVKAIQAIIDKYDKLVEYMEGHKGSASKDDLAALGFSDADIQRILRGEISIKDLTDRLKELKGELKQKSPYQSFIGNMKDAIAQLKKATTKEEKANAFGQIASSIKDALPALKEFGSEVANIFGKDDSKLSSAIDGLDGMMTAGQGVAQIMSGDIVGGAMSAVKGISQMVDAFDGMFGADYSSYNNMVEQYDRLIDVWDTLLDRKQEYIDMSYGPEATKAGQEAIDIIEKQTEAYRNLGREWLNSGASAGSHSQGVRQRKKMNSDDWANVAAALGRTTDNYAGLGGRLEGLFSLSAEELRKLQEQAPEFWAKLNDETQKYLQGIIDGEQKIEDIQKQVNEQLTSTTFDSLKDSFANALYDMESTADKAGENIGEALFKSIVDNFILDDDFDQWLQGFYEKWAKKIGSGTMTRSDWDEYNAEYQRELGSRMAQRDAWAQAVGYTGKSGSDSEGSATYNAAKSFTQEQGDILNGRLTAIQHGVRDNGIHVRSIDLSIAKITDRLSQITDIADESRSLIAESILHLRSINENTGAIVKPIQQMQSDINAMKVDIHEKL